MPSGRATTGFGEEDEFLPAFPLDGEGGDPAA